MSITLQKIALSKAILGILLAFNSPSAKADLTVNVESGGWPTPSHRNAAVASVQAAVDRYNDYGDFGNASVYVYYNSGIPTAQASYLGSIGFGGFFPNERVSMHELAHYVGSGTTANYASLMVNGTWQGEQTTALVKQFDGTQAVLNGDTFHFWPYGLNFDQEGSEINKQRQVAILYAQRADMGLGPTAHPATATSVSLVGSDPVGTSGFNYKDNWSDGYFVHAGADYFSGDFAIRTPTGSNSYEFAGNSLTLNGNANDAGLYFMGTGSNGTITIEDLKLDGGSVQHMSSFGDLFRLDGNLTVVSDSSIRATLGHIDVLAALHGDDSLVVEVPASRAAVRFYADDSTFSGNLINEARFELTDGANFTFKVEGPGDSNSISGPTAISTLLDGKFQIDDSSVEYALGNSWQLVTAANTSYGATFEVEGFANESGVWKSGSYTFDQATGLLSVSLGADFDSDGILDVNDWLTFSANHLADLSGFDSQEQLARGDLDRDGDNDYDDFRQFKFQYDAINGAGSFAAISHTTIPEPSMLSLCVVSVVCGRFARLDRKRKINL